MKFKQLKISGTGYKEIGNDDFWYSAEYPEVKQWLEEGNTPEPEFTSEEIKTNELNQKVQEANQYLAQTDWVNFYKIRHDLGLDLIPESSSKWEVINKREEYIEFLKGVK